MIDQQMAYTIWKIGKIDNEEFPPLLDNNHLPGPMCMKKLSKFGIFNRLTSNTGYSHKTAISMCGRSNIVNDLIIFFKKTYSHSRLNILKLNNSVTFWITFLKNKFDK